MASRDHQGKVPVGLLHLVHRERHLVEAEACRWPGTLDLGLVAALHGHLEVEPLGATPEARVDWPLARQGLEVGVPGRQELLAERLGLCGGLSGGLLRHLGQALLVADLLQLLHHP
jgi:hypothetical protein